MRELKISEVLDAWSRTFQYKRPSNLMLLPKLSCRIKREKRRMFANKGQLPRSTRIAQKLIWA